MINFAYAEPAANAAAAGPQSILLNFLPWIIIFAAFYFLMVRPNQKKAKQHQEMLAALKKGDRVQTASGIIGKVNKINDTTATLEIATGVLVDFNRNAITDKLES